MALKALTGTNAKLASISARRIAVAKRAVRVCTNAVKFDYDTKVFQKELVKFADTEEYIYRSELREVSHGTRPVSAFCTPIAGYHGCPPLNGCVILIRMCRASIFSSTPSLFQVPAHPLSLTTLSSSSYHSGADATSTRSFRRRSRASSRSVSLGGARR